MKTRRPPVPPLLVLAFAIVAASTAAIFIRYAQEYAPSLVIAAARLSIATLILTPIALTRYRAELMSLSRKDLGLALLSGVFLALHFATWISSLEYTTVASSVVLVSTVPLWVALLSPITLKEPITRLVLLGMLLALVGGAIVGLSDACTFSGGSLVCPAVDEFIRGQAFFGNILALIGAITAAGYLIIGRSIRARVSLITYIFVVYGIAAVLLVILMFAVGLTPFGYPAETYLWLLLLALVPQLLGHSTYNWALEYLSAAYVSIALLGEPIGSAILAYYFLAEVPTPLKIFGAILILTGIFIASMGETKPQKEQSSSPA
jgi:drug/metabolite transporter (DMT)-like permease